MQEYIIGRYSRQACLLATVAQARAVGLDRARSPVPAARAEALASAWLRGGDCGCPGRRPADRRGRRPAFAASWPHARRVLASAPARPGGPHARVPGSVRRPRRGCAGADRLPGSPTGRTYS